MKKLLLLTFVFLGFVSLELVEAQSKVEQSKVEVRNSQRNKLGVETTHYITRETNGVSQRFFPIGAFVSNWPQSIPDYHHRFTSEKEWTSAREVFYATLESLS